MPTGDDTVDDRSGSGCADVGGRAVVELRYEVSLDPYEWSRRHRLGLVPGLLPYGFDRLADCGFQVRPRVPPAALTGLAGRIEHRLGRNWRHARRGSRADVVVCPEERIGVPSALVGGAPVFTNVVWATEAPTRLEVQGLRRAAGVWVWSSGQLPRLAELGVHRPVWVPMAVDLDFFAATDYQPSPLVVSVGNDRHRDWDTLLRAYRRLGDAGAGLRLLTRVRVPVGNEPGVELIGQVGHRELTDHYRQAAVVAIALRPNLHASGVTTALEAMASSRPVVVSDTPGFRDYVQHGVNGLLVPVGDADAMAAAIRQLLADPELSAAMGAAGRALVEDRFSLTEQARVMAAALHQL